MEVKWRLKCFYHILKPNFKYKNKKLVAKYVKMHQNYVKT